MVSFNCLGCGDVIKKPKLDQHRSRCNAAFDCIDCSTTFNTPAEYKGHTQCISEAEKYQKSLYKGPKTATRGAHNGRGRGGFTGGGRDGGWFRPKYSGTGANDTPLGTPPRMSPVTTPAATTVAEKPEHEAPAAVEPEKKKEKSKKRKLVEESTVDVGAPALVKKPKFAEEPKTMEDVTIPSPILPDVDNRRKDKKSKKEKEEGKLAEADIVPGPPPENEGKKKKKDKKDKKKRQAQEVQGGVSGTGDAEPKKAQTTNLDGDVEMSAPVDEPKETKKTKKEKRQKLKDPIATEAPTTASTEPNDHSQKQKEMEDIATSAPGDEMADKAPAEKLTKSKKIKKAGAKEGGSKVPAGTVGVNGHSMEVDRPDPQPLVIAVEGIAKQTEDVASTAPAEKNINNAPVEKTNKAKKNKKGKTKEGGSEVFAEVNGHSSDVNRPDPDPPSTAAAESSENIKSQKQKEDVVTSAATDDKKTANASAEKPKKSKKNKKETGKEEVLASAAEVNGGSMVVDQPAPPTLASDASVSVLGKNKKDKQSKERKDKREKKESKQTASLPTR